MDCEESYKLFFSLLELPRIKNLLKNDKCKVLADRYILANIFIFFRRANFDRKEYNRKNFYLALYLAHELQEDVDDFKDDIIEDYLGPRKQYVRKHVEKFLNDRFALLQRIDFDGYVSKAICDSIIKEAPHWAWRRIRNAEHSGVLYKYSKCKKCNLY